MAVKLLSIGAKLKEQVGLNSLKYVSVEAKTEQGRTEMPCRICLPPKKTLLAVAKSQLLGLEFDLRKEHLPRSHIHLPDSRRLRIVFSPWGPLGRRFSRPRDERSI